MHLAAQKLDPRYFSKAKKKKTSPKAAQVTQRKGKAGGPPPSLLSPGPYGQGPSVPHLWRPGDPTCSLSGSPPGCSVFRLLGDSRPSRGWPVPGDSGPSGAGRTHAGLSAGLLGWALACWPRWALACWPRWSKNSCVSADAASLRLPASRSSGRFPQRPDERGCVTEVSGLTPTPHALRLPVDGPPFRNSRRRLSREVRFAAT